MLRIFWFSAAAAMLLVSTAKAQDWEILPGVHLSMPLWVEEQNRSTMQLDCGSLREICVHKDEFGADGVAGCRRYHKICE